MKKCPFCAEEIQEEAIKCRYCNEIIVGNPLLNTLEKPPAPVKVPWYCAWWFMATIFFAYMPYSMILTIPLFWIHPRWSQTTKIVWTVMALICAGMTWFVTVTIIGPFLKNLGGGEMNTILQLLGPSLGQSQ